MALVSWRNKGHGYERDFTGRFIWRCLEVAGVNHWSELTGCPVRAKVEAGRVVAVGHFLRDEWFCPQEEFA